MLGLFSTEIHLVMSVVQRQVQKSQLIAKDILHEFQWFIILVALIFTSIGFLIDTLQLLSAFNWIAADTSDESRFFYIVYSNAAILINIAIIGSFAYLIYLLSTRRIKVINATLWYAVLVCLNNTIPYFWIAENQIAVAGYLWRDYVMFTILVFVVSTCTFGRYVYYVAVYAVLMSVVVSLLSGNAFLRENIPMFLFTIAGFAYCLWKKDTLLKKIVTRQSEERNRIEQLSSFKEKMNSMLFHDIKLPLNSIIQQANAVSPENPTSQIGVQAEKVKRMLSNMIDIASTSDARLELSACGFRLSELLQKVSQKTLYSIPDDSIQVECGYEGVDYELFGDRDLIERALINIVDNAVKYSPRNGVISILTEANCQWITIRILDQGPGIQDGEREKIFQLFYSANQPENVKKSSGIGLAFCKLVAEAHNGSVTINLPEFGGSEFIFRLPIVVSEAEGLTDSSAKLNEKYSEELRNSLSHLLPSLRKLRYYQTSEIYSLFSSTISIDLSLRSEFEEIKKKALSSHPIHFSELLNQLS